MTETRPVPVRGMLSGEVAVLLDTERDAERVLGPRGEKVTLMVQEAFMLREAGQLLVWVKSPGFVPVMEMEEMDMAAVPVLVRVTGEEVLDCSSLTAPKVSEVGLKEAIGVPPLLEDQVSPVVEMV